MTPKAFDELVAARRSIRGFSRQVVPETTMRAIFTTAQRAPSNCNIQPWKVAVVSGERCRTLAERISAAMLAGDIQMDFPYDGVYEGEHKVRQHAAAAELYGAMGIAREDKAARGEAFMRNFHFFEAPHVAFFFLPQGFGIREAADVGMYAQTVMLAMTAHGLGCCPQTALSFQPHIVREELGIGNDRKLLFGLSFGYPDLERDENRCRTSRAPLNEVVTFY